MRRLAARLAAVLLLGACSAAPTTAPITAPTSAPTQAATQAPPAATASQPTTSATSGATATPSAEPSEAPSGTPSVEPSSPPSIRPSEAPSVTPSTIPSLPGDSFDPTAIAVRLEPFADGLDSPVFVTGTRDGSGRLFVVEQTGRIRIINRNGKVAEQPFLDISDRIAGTGERGLLGLALHPDFPDNGRFFVDYTRAPDGATVISEFHADGDQADAASERVLLTIDQPFSNHNGGMVAFDSEGMLMIGMGDGGSGGDPMGNGQNPDALLAKLLRIDVDGAQPYAVPADNPFVDTPGTRPEIWDMGMRNPWRYSFDRLTGDLWIGDVGQGLWEETDAEPALSGGRDYGWNIMEGPVCYRAQTCDQTGLTPPVSAYQHDAATCTVIGGYVYRGTAHPEWQDGYFFGDYCSGTIWALSAADGLARGNTARDEVAETDATVSSFGEDDDGELYVVDLRGNVFRMVPDA